MLSYFALLFAIVLFCITDAIVVTTPVRAVKATKSTTSNSNIFDARNRISTSVDLFDFEDINYYMMVDIGTPPQVQSEDKKINLNEFSLVIRNIVSNEHQLYMGSRQFICAASVR